MTIRIMPDKGYPKGYRPYFYLVFKLKRKTKNRVMPDCPIRGNPPPSLSMFDKGDEVYERSKEKAKNRAKEYEKEQKVKNNEAKILSDIIEIKTGKAPKKIDIKLSELYDHWVTRPREGEISKGRKQMAAKAFKELASFLKGKTYIIEVTKEDGRSFYEWLKKTYTKGAIQSKIGVIRGEFKDSLPANTENPFERITKKKGGIDDSTVHRELLTFEETDKVLTFAAQHLEPMMYDITVGASETGMRIGDVCRLKWEDVHWESNHIFCLTGKAHKRVIVPISDLLRERLVAAQAIEGEEASPYVWPDAARMYMHNRTGIYKRGTKLLGMALFGDLLKSPPVTVIEDDNKPALPLTIYGAIDFIKASRFTDSKKAGIIKVLEAKLEGKTTTQIVKDLHFNKSMVCDYLREVFRTYGLDLRTQRTPLSRMKEILDKTRISRAVGQRSASKYGWHSFRGTFAFKAHYLWGVSLDDVKLLLGHSDTDTTLNNYLNPSKKMMIEAARYNKDAKNLLARKTYQPVIDVMDGTTTVQQQPRATNILTLIKALPKEFQEKIASLPPEDKAEFRKLTSVEDAKLFLSAY